MSEAGDRHPRDRLRRVLTLPDAVLLIVSSVVGSGIFLTPGRIADLLPHPGLVFAAWLAGGDYVYLREAFHPLAGFLVGWLSFFAIFVGTIATLAAGFAAGLRPYLGYGDGGALAVAIGVTVAASALYRRLRAERGGASAEEAEEHHSWGNRARRILALAGR